MALQSHKSTILHHSLISLSNWSPSNFLIKIELRLSCEKLRHLANLPQKQCDLSFSRFVTIHQRCRRQTKDEKQTSYGNSRAMQLQLSAKSGPSNSGVIVENKTARCYGSPCRSCCCLGNLLRVTKCRRWGPSQLLLYTVSHKTCNLITLVFLGWFL